jgi:uncharacterized protein (DUF1697 family)
MKYFAFLRAINVGGHNVKMAALKQIFESLGFTQIRTFIASGNVGFESPSKQTKELEKSLEKKLQSSLGFEVATFLRTEAELTEISNFKPFSESALKTAVSVNVAFLKDSSDDEVVRKVMTLKTLTDEFNIHGREVYWLVRTRQSESSFSNAVLEKTIKASSTIRGIETIKKMIRES